ncbi:MAG: cobyrinate a,c-diamide synthase [Rhodomicrobium sp.]|nr:cobyrinate a,c-diamide synthase [Rhodomicrobium sp.]
MPRLFLSAAHKSSGKTTVSIGIAAALTARGLAVQSFKKGPDYIDPMWLARATGRPCFNLDFNTQTHAEIVESVASRAALADFALIEGNKGLHDGVDVEGADSSAALAKLAGAPVILVIDTLGMTRGVAPLILGYQAFDRGISIAGIILNKVGAQRQQDKVCQAIERYTDIPVHGALPRSADFTIEERHLGLMTPMETPESRAAIERLRRAVEDGVDLDRLIAAGKAAPALPRSANPPTNASGQDLRIAIARDSAFGFYYPDDLETFERLGAKLCFFDALSDSRLPEADGLFIGGGFPETQAAQLEANVSLRADIASKIRLGLPAYAECGGMMYLARSIRWRERSYEMAGVIPADAVMHMRPQGRGLVLIEETPNAPWPQPRGDTAAAKIHAHEFHYASLENLDPSLRFAYKVVRGAGLGAGRDGIVLGNLIANFSHLRATAANPWVERFLRFVRVKRRGSNPADSELAQALVEAPATTC